MRGSLQCVFFVNICYCFGSVFCLVVSWVYVYLLALRRLWDFIAYVMTFWCLRSHGEDILELRCGDEMSSADICRKFWKIQ